MIEHSADHQRHLILLNGCSHSEYVFESNVHCYYSMENRRNWGHRLTQSKSRRNKLLFDVISLPQNIFHFFKSWLIGRLIAVACTTHSGGKEPDYLAAVIFNY